MWTKDPSSSSSLRGVDHVVTRELLPQVELDRSNDAVYSATTSVARVVIDMIRGVQQAQMDKYLELVKVKSGRHRYCYKRLSRTVVMLILRDNMLPLMSVCGVCWLWTAQT